MKATTWVVPKDYGRLRVDDYITAANIQGYQHGTIKHPNFGNDPHTRYRVEGLRPTFCARGPGCRFFTFKTCFVKERIDEYLLFILPKGLGCLHEGYKPESYYQVLA